MNQQNREGHTNENWKIIKIVFKNTIISNLKKNQPKKKTNSKSNEKKEERCGNTSGVRVLTNLFNAFCNNGRIPESTKKK